VIFGPSGNMGVGGIQGVTDGVTYYARVIDDFTIQLFDSAAHARGEGDTGLINILRSEARIVQREDIDFTSGGRVTEISIIPLKGIWVEGGTTVILTDYENDLICNRAEDITVIDSAFNTIKFGVAHTLQAGTG
jgi:hypothetical protein